MAVLKKLFIPVVILLSAAAIVVLLSMAKPLPKPQAPVAAEIPKMAAMVASPQTRRVSVTAQGTVQPKTEITLAAQVGGQVVSVSEQFVDGGFFQQHDLLLQLDDRDYRIALVQAESRVADAEKTVATERGQARQAKREWRDLGNTEGNALFLREPQLKAAEAALAAAKADLEQARINLQRTAIRAPFDGRVREKQVDRGQYLSPGMQVASIFATGTAEIRLPLTASQVPLLDLPLQPGDQASLPVRLHASFNGLAASWSGELVRTEASMDTRSRVLYGIVEVAEPLRQQPPLVIGLFVHADVAGKQFADVIEVPRDALYEKDRLLVLDGDNRLHITPVRVLQLLGEQALVSGIEAGQRILIERPGYVVEGMAVEPVMGSALADTP
ncbi:efflux RND transporter periplasmic adaptor subunit [Porticoccus sp.]